MSNITTNAKNQHISENIWLLYKEAYFYPLMPIHHYKNGAIISVWNTHGHQLSRKKNTSLQQKYIALLSRLPSTIKYLYGGNHDMSYRELSVCLDLPLTLAQSISKRYNQRAFYYLVDGKITLYNSHNLAQFYTFNDLITSRLRRVTLPSKNAALL
ncbi:DUF3293 domain-containing protein [Pseudoalteromonas obscura]|uniref:DUF3293 domain-containing protein n=1 Tax=Pseudoalteromonas obscura TaxID=3048491 RepID=A0ABT7ELY6_9GAMM|nr:DUF3293 domain-containing protein [Pseudoalteromonas sp. P94(2023)]MDK2596066.1 DUF3293 domain-containing protein [Pseudoalteromonas sp. P94(2023)]